MTAASSAERWQAVLAHDRRFDGRFFYGVKSTGIYCRPSCPSRRPKSETGVQFFADHVTAEIAGFRACQRCRPREVSAQIAMVERVSAILRNRADERVTLEEHAATVGVSPFHLQRNFKRFTGLSSRAYQEAQRNELFKQQLRSNDSASVAEAVYAVGYGSSSRAYEESSARLGMTPAQYRRAGSGQSIHYTTFDSTIGKVLIAMTEKGVCALRLGEDESALIAELKREFGNAYIARNDVRLEPFVQMVKRYLVSTGEDTPELPLDLRASTFQARVWQALRGIPRGETRTYSDIAVELGAPNSTRAVARACATNPVALAIPCHRVIAKSGSLAGYRWGIERKRRLLQAEQQ